MPYVDLCIAAKNKQFGRV
jgi:hypothetical protein